MRRATCSVLVAVLLTCGTAARAQPAQAQPAQAQPAQPAQAQPAQPAQAQPDLNFELMEEKKQTPADESARVKHALEIENKVKHRRVMLQWHQGLGFTMLGVMAATLVIGQLHYMDKFGGGDDTGKYEKAHLGLAISSSALFAATGLLGAFAPNPYPKPVRMDAALVHKVSMIVATAGMVAQLILGPISWSHEGKLDQKDLAITHLVIGYTSYAFMATGVLAYVF